MKVGVLSVQGAFAEMEAYWRAQGADVFEIRQLADLDRGLDLLALPGGESTVQGKLLNDLGLFEPLKKAIDGGLPVFATCAGLILLAEKIDDEGGRPRGEDRRRRRPHWSAALPVVRGSSCRGEAQRLRTPARQLQDLWRLRREAWRSDDVHPRSRHNGSRARSRGPLDVQRLPDCSPLAQHNRFHLAPRAWVISSIQYPVSNIQYPISNPMMAGQIGYWIMAVGYWIFAH